MELRHEPTGIAKQYLDFCRNGAPKCCQICEHYNKDGLCEVYENAPPSDFASQINDCEHWSMEIPF